MGVCGGFELEHGTVDLIIPSILHPDWLIAYLSYVTKT